MTTLLQPTDLVQQIEQSTDLHALTEIVRRGKQTTIEVVTALRRIRDAGLYKLTHKSWEAWCAENWWSSKRHADRQIASIDVMENLGPGVPIGGRIARELAAIAPEQRQLVLADATKLAGGTPTAAQVRDAIELRADGKAKSPGEQDMRTPLWLFRALEQIFHVKFKLDAYASPHNALCEKYWTVDDDGNVKPWVDGTFWNPRFKKGDKAGMALATAKAVAEQNLGNLSIGLGPVGCSQEWFHDHGIQGTVFKPDCRINFDEPDGEPTDGADRDSDVYAFGKGWKNQHWKKGEFRVRQLKIKHLVPAPRVVERKYIPMGPEE